MFRKQMVAFVLAAAILTVPAFAHGCKGRRFQTVDASCGLCTVEDCAITGRNTHRGVTYCGYDHADGVCDCVCLNAAPAQTGEPASYGYGHHGGHHGGRHH